MQTNICSNSKIVNAIILIVILALIFMCLWPSFSSWITKMWCGKSKPNESFVDVTKTVDNTIPIDYKQDDVEIIQPPLYNAYDDTIQSGSLFIPQPEYYNTQGEKIILGDVNQPGSSGPTDIGDNGLNFNLCSKSCCSDQWPVPFKMPVDKMTCGNTDEFVPSNYFCNNGWQDSGCLCLKKDQADFVNSRGQNSDL